jgi:hypothetical protein
VYRAVRDAASAAGCVFTLDDPSGYFAWPLVSLLDLLESGRIPYRRTAAAFRRLEESRPGFFTTRHAEHVAPQVNVVLHEAAHCVAERMWVKAAPRLGGVAAQHRTVLRYAVGEAFANATELAAMAHAQTPEDQWLLALNSYWAHIAAMPATFGRLGKEIGREATVAWLLSCFLGANLCRETLSAKLRSELLELAGIGKADAARPSVRAGLDFLAGEAMSLNIDFRLHTSAMFFASIGLSPNVKTLTSFDFVRALRSDEAAMRVLSGLAALLAGASRPTHGVGAATPG